MANNNVKATVTVTMNGESAKRVMNALENQAKKLKKDLNEARFSGDTKKIKAVERELRAVENSIRSVKKETKSYQDILKNLNGSTIRELEAAARDLRKEIKNKLIPGTKEFIDKSKQLKNVETRIKSVTFSTKEQTGSFSKVAEKFNKYFSIVTAGIAAVTGLSLAFRKSAQDAAKMSDNYANVMKYTGLTTDQVNELNESLKKLDTRTSREKLNDLAAEAGKLGIKGKEAVLEFVEAADVINVALGEDLGEDAVKQIGKLTNMFGETEKYGLRAAMLKVGSTINEVAQNSTASEEYLLEFTNRLSGIGNQANMTIPQIMGLASVLDQNAQAVELSSTAIDTFIVNMVKNTSKVADAAGIAREELQNLVNTDMNTALLRVFEELNKKGGLVDLAPLFADLGANGGRAAKIISVLAQNYEKLIKEQNLAKNAFDQGTSATKEFGVQNDTMQAKMEKARKSFFDVSEELGRKLSPILLKSTNLTTNLIKAISSLGKTYTENKAIILSLAAAWITYIAIKQRKYLLDLKDQILTKSILVIEKAQLALTNLRKIALLSYIVVKNRLTGATLKAAAAQKVLKATMASTPWGAILAAVSAIAVGIYKVATSTTAAEKALKEFNKESAKEIAQVTYLFDALKTAEKGSVQYTNALNKLIEIYPDIMKRHVEEEGYIKNLAAAEQDLIAAIETRIAVQMRDTAKQDIIAESIEKQKNTLDDFMNKLPKNIQDTQGAAIRQRIKNLADEGKSTIEIIEKLNREYNLNLKAYNQKYTAKGDYVVWTKEALLITALVVSMQNMQKELKKVDDSFSFLSSNAGSLLEHNIETLQKALLTAETKDERKALQEEIDLLREKQKITTDPPDPPDPSTELSKIENWLTAQQNLLKQDRNQNIISEEEYNEKLKQLTIQAIQKKLAIKEQEQAAYLQLNSELLDAQYDQESRNQEERIKKLTEEQRKLVENAQDELNDLVSKNANIAEQSPILKAIYGTAKDFDDKKADMLSKVKELQSQIATAKTDAEKEKIQESINALNGLINDIDTQKWIAVSNTIKKEVGDVTDFITSEKEKQEMAGLSEKEQQIRIIEQLYKKERDVVEEAIKEQSKLQTEEAQKEVERLKALLAELMKMENDAKSKVSDKLGDLESGIDSVDRFMDSIQKFQDALTELKKGADLKDVVKDIADAMQLLTDFAFSAVNSINQISKNKGDQELQDYKNVCDQKKAALQDQLNSGLISQDEYNQQLAQIDQELEAKENKIKSEQFEQEKRASVIQALIGGALAIVQCFAQLGPIGGAIAAVLVAGVTALQIAAIATQPNPYEGGGSTSAGSAGASPIGGRTVTEGYSEGGNTAQAGSDNIPVGVVHANEWVAPAWMVRENPVLFNNLENVRQSKASIDAEKSSYAIGGYTTPTSMQSGIMGQNIAKQLTDAITKLQNTPFRTYLVRKDLTEMDEQDQRFKKITGKK